MFVCFGLLVLLFLPNLHSRFQGLNGCLPIPRIVQDSKVGGAVHHAHAVLKSFMDALREAPGKEEAFSSGILPKGVSIEEICI